MLFGTQKVIDNTLHIGGVSAKDLVKEYGSPLYVYDQSHIENMIQLFKEHFKSTKFNANIAYASKALLIKEMVRLTQRNNLYIDSVSAGELYAINATGFDMSKVLFHGNNKSVEELIMALDMNVGLIVVDNRSELEILLDLAEQRKQKVNTILRVNPGIEAHTHEYIITAKLTSKFGESIFDEEGIDQIVDLYQASEYVTIEGFHCHIGSQVFGRDPFIETVQVMSDFMSKVEKRKNVTFETLNIGGGFGVYYTNEDEPENLGELLEGIIQTAEKVFEEKELQIRNLFIEPGRSLVSNAGTTLYEVGYIKKTYGGKNYLFVNGGMTDNIRPALYQAKYSSDIATNMLGEKTNQFTIAGKLCESGDVLVKEALLQDAKYKDILAIYTTGAYGYSMSSNYNKMLRPAIVFVKDNESKLVVKRETFEDLIKNDL